MLLEKQRQAGNGTQPPHPFFGHDAFIPPDATPSPPPPKKHSKLEHWKSQGGILGTIAAILLAIAKVGAPLFSLLFKFKLFIFLKTFLITGGSMLVSMWFWSTQFGWPFAAGFVILIFIHECGHAIAARMLGYPMGVMVFIPFCGALVTIKKGSRNVVEDAHIGIMGPVFGTIGGILCLVIYRFHPITFWLALAYFNFFINLFNLLPTPPLDGGWITPLISPKLLAVGVVLLFIVAPRNPMIWILVVLSLPRIISGWKAKPTDPFYQAPMAQRWKYGLAYVGLAAFLGYSVLVLQDELKLRRRPSQQVASISVVRPRS